ncbi:hypothetical protein MCOR25_004071 [Pyricularia grisea]|uniref:LPXTG-motif cell wall anchor domain-containing protein n=1 Tax=Pyricularia grisea TaxID=148305 RepID=A0A6P8AT28_PYRGI|nr:uncharacterized protein PgNI_09533 [Pyricularia grisea]KAI6370939.1 hypothetical protein MCOR25_004071 [Pyricularia grisea]TLD05263.1 hypothetical protein PgNI_09533 [Pyricularia grisea]
MASSAILGSLGGFIGDNINKHLVNGQAVCSNRAAGSTTGGSNGRDNHQNDHTRKPGLGDKSNDLTPDANSNPHRTNNNNSQQLATPTPESTPSHQNLHTHRQNHNSSKLPAFRFADLKQSPAQKQQIPLSPVSPAHSTHHSNSSPLGSTISEHEPASEHQHPQSKQQHQNSLQRNPSPDHPGIPPGATAAAEHATEANSTNSSKKAIPATETAAERGEKPVSTQPTLTVPGLDNSSVSLDIPTSSINNNNNTKIPKNTAASPLRERLANFHTTTASTGTPKPIKATFTVRRHASLPADSSSVHLKPDRTQYISADTPQSTVSASSTRHARHRYSDPSSETIAISSRARSRQATEQGEPAVEAAATGTNPKDSVPRSRVLLAGKSSQLDDESDDKRKFKSRPPVSFRPLRSDAPVIRVPPIRSFRSSGSRKSWALDTTAKTMRSTLDEGTFGDDSRDPNHRDRTLWALEGRTPTDTQMTPPDSAVATPDADNTADLFMKIASEDAPPAPEDGDRQLHEPSTVSRVSRSFHRRPQSTVIPPSHTPTSPPQITRRLSDQRETIHFQRASSEQPGQQTTREWAQRAVGGRERSVQIDDRARSRVLVAPPALKSSPVTPRSPPSQDTPDGFFSHSRRRTSITDNSMLPSRTASLKTSAYGHTRTFNSSPLVPRQPEPHAPEGTNGLAAEGTESSASTAAPSTVWDELDDIRSRIHRLELTGKTPATSGHAMSRVSDDRPRTATTNATTMSGSPKRPGAHLAADASSTTSSQRESQPILLSAVSKARPYMNNDAFGALESAASEVLSLTQMLGSVGQPGPISSGASTIGGGSNVTDRQLRRKADSICRSLTEMCLSLADEAAQRKNSAGPETTRDKEAATTSPTRVFSSITGAGQRRTVAASEVGLSRINTTISPRTLPRPDERRATFLGSGVASSPRLAMSPATPNAEPSTPGTGRRSSLLISRTRRAGTEEPEDSSGGRKPSLLMRTRRAGTEEPDEGRKTSLLLRSQRAAYVEDEDDSPRMRAPSRAATELGAFRRDYTGSQQQQQSVVASSEASGLLSVSQSRRRLVSSSLNSRLMAPSAAQSASPSRRYFDRSTPERDVGNIATEKLAEDRGQRQFTFGHNRATSLSKRRESGIPSFMGSAAASHVGTYR